MEATPVTQTTQTKKGLSGSTLKIIAIVTMAIDHVGAALLGRLMNVSGYMQAAYASDMTAISEWLMANGLLYGSYMTMRMIGRIAFPIFCFLLVEGFLRTGNVKKYALRLGGFALISEIPFDLAFNAKVLEFTYQNVFFTLFLGLLTMIVFDKIIRTAWPKIVKLLLCAPVLAAGGILAEILQTDYAATGVICIMVLYLFRNSKPWQLVAGCAAFLWELTAPLAFIPIAFYNGERGLKLKYFFYAFYPAHLLIIYLISACMGIAGYAAI